MVNTKLFSLGEYDVLQTMGGGFLAQRLKDSQTEYLSVLFHAKSLSIGHSSHAFQFKSLSKIVEAIQLEHFLANFVD